MNVIRFIFQLILRFVPVSNTDYDDMFSQATDWYRTLPRYEPEYFDQNGDKVPEQNKNIKGQFKYYSEKWYIRLALCILYIFAVKEIASFMANSGKEPDEEKETF